MKISNGVGRLASRVARTCLLGVVAHCLPAGAQAPLRAAADPTRIEDVRVEGGWVRGVASDVPGVQVFKGIPFAADTGGANRWRPPQPVPVWEGVRVADTWGDQGLQPEGRPGEPPVSENGLNLVVYTPARHVRERLPVYMLIYGGANRGGRASQPALYASRLAAKGIVVVAVQHRMGPQGFLALPAMARENPEGRVGNLAILDLVHALRWIRSHVAGFGGDPARVTIGGESSGAENVTALLRSPLALGLFQRAFMSSNFTGFLPGKYVPAREKAAQNQAAVDRIFGRPMSLDDLRAIEPQTWLSPWQGSKEPLYTLVHNDTVRGQFYTVDGHVFTPESIDLLRPGALDGLDLMLGGTADEYTALRGGENRTMTPAEFDQTMRAPHGYGNFGVLDDGYLPLYRPETELDAYRLWLRALSDRQFAGYRVSAETALARNRRTRVYTFYWDHVPPGRNEGFYRAFHAADVPYFNASLREEPSQRRWTDPDHRMADLASSYLAHFVRTGDPNGPGLPRWGQATARAGSPFLWLKDGQAQLVNQTPHPSRDTYHRALIRRANGLID